jgi:hypothetical protein
MRRIYTLLFLFLLMQTPIINAQILPSFGGSRTGTTGMQFLKIGVDARSAGLGGNAIAIISDVAAVNTNVAGLAKLDTNRLHLQMGRNNYFADLGLNFGGIAYRPNAQTVWAVSLTSLVSGAMPVTTEFQPFGTGETFGYNAHILGISYAKTLTDNFSFGISTKYATEAIAGIKTQNALFDFGFQYEIGLANTRFAVSVNNFGLNVQPNGKITMLSLQGATDATDFEQISVPAIFKIGFACDAISTPMHKLTALAQLNHPTDNNETLGIGTEYMWNNTFFARTGYEFGLDESGLPAFGIGVRTQRNFGKLSFDYGFNNKVRLGSVHLFTVGVGF